MEVTPWDVFRYISWGGLALAWVVGVFCLGVVVFAWWWERMDKAKERVSEAEYSATHWRKRYDLSLSENVELKERLKQIEGGKNG